MKKAILLVLLSVLMSFTVVSFSEVTGNELARIGLNYKNKNAPNIVVSSQESLALFASVERKPVKIFECDSKSVTFEKGSSSRVNVIVDKRFSTFSELFNEVGALRRQNSKSFYYYDQGWYLALGRYESSSQAKSQFKSFSGVTSNQLTTRKTASDDVYLMANGKSLLAYKSDTSDFFVASTTYPDKGIVTYDGKTYRGGIGGNRSVSNDMSVINYLLMDHYLYGILPKEMSGKWPIEALKAQAVVARNFAITSFEKHSDEGYDLCDNTDCQVYGGYSVEAVGSNLAVDESTGDLLYYNDELVIGFYHSNSGGKTASIENVWTSSIPYLKSVEDPFSVGSPNTDWIVMMSPDEISDKLAIKNYFIGTLKSIKVNDVARDGRVQEIQFIGSKETATLKKEEMRKVFGYVTFKSIWFEVLTDNVMTVANTSEYTQLTLSDASAHDGSLTSSLANKSTITVIGANGKKTIDMSPSTYTFVGHGFGHGIGMSQWGAKKMADEGYSYEEILYHYYSDTKIINN